MISRRVATAPPEISEKSDVLADNGDHDPMSQQDAVASHTPEMHPQKFVRLVGCHDARNHEGAISSALADQPTFATPNMGEAQQKAAAGSKKIGDGLCSTLYMYSGRASPLGSNV